MRDDLSEEFGMRRGEERLNAGPWRPVGTLAAAVFRFPHEPPEAKRHLQHPFVRRIWRELHARPERDAAELLTNAGRVLQIVRLNGFGRVKWHLDRELLPPDPWCALLLRQLPIVRRIAEKIVRAPSHPSHRPLAEDLNKAVGTIVRWTGCTRNEEQFLTTPAGAVLISTLFGQTRGGLRLCGSCGGFVVFPRLGFPRKYCDKCKDLSPERADRATGLPSRKAFLWRKVLARMRRRTFKRLGLNDTKERKSWKMKAIRAIHEAKTEEQLKTWEESFAPKGKPGRPPRKK